MYKLLVIGIVFLLGFYFIYKSNDIETFTDKDYKIAEKCPDVLIQKGAAFFLYNSKRANVPGINPIRFESLEEYTEFVDWQRSQGILCPVLFLQHAYNAQGEPVYKARPSPLNLVGGQPDYVVTADSLPPGLLETQKKMLPPPADVPIQGVYGRPSVMPTAKLPKPTTMSMQNSNLTGALPQNSLPMLYPGFDPKNQDIAPLDNMFNQANGAVSGNPMDDNWGGVEYTENLVNAGYYKDNEVSKVSF